MVYTFPKDINRKENVIARQEFELGYRDFAVQHVSHYGDFLLKLFVLLIAIWIVHKLFVFDKNTWNYITVYNLFDRYYFIAYYFIIDIFI